MRIYGITLPAGFEIIYNKSIKMYDLAIHCNIGRNHRFLSRKRKLDLSEFSKMIQIARLWAYVSEGNKTVWGQAGDIDGMSGYNLYFQERAYRLKHGISGDPTPSLNHIYLVGHINIPIENNKATIRQYYPHPIYFPATFSLSYKSKLTASGPSPSVKLTLKYTYLKLGESFTQTNIQILGLNDAWNTKILTLTRTYSRTYDCEAKIELIDCYGDIWFDNAIFTYNGINHSFDHSCNDVYNNWEQVDFPLGNLIESVYPTGDAL